MRLKHRHEDDARTADPAADEPSTTDRPDMAEGAIERDEPAHERPVVAERAESRDETIETVETVRHRWDVGSVLATAAGVALIVIGAVALVRAEINETWYQPVVEVAGLSHTPLLGAIEVGVGALLVLTGLAGARTAAAFVALVAGVAAAVVALEPDLVDSELALERGWATALAIAGVALALVLVMSRGRRVECRIERRPVTA
jgi:lysylphosphatidylglycerol synthetase-like protein (DUF2156 family)